MVSKQPIKKWISARQYFTVIGLLTFCGLSTLVWQDAQSQQAVKEVFGLAKPLVATEESFYQQRVAVIFDKYCVGCHGDIKAKGHLRMDSFRHTVFGGKNGDMLTGGDNSLLYQRMLLPEENRLAMPPYGRDRQTDDEMKVIQQWLAKGASGILSEADFPNAPSKPKVIKFAKVDKHAIEQTRSEYAAQVISLQEKYPYLLAYIARTSANLQLSANNQKTFSDRQLADFIPVADQISQLDLSNTAITAKAISSILQMTNLEKLNLRQTQLSSTEINRLVQLKKLKVLILPKIGGIEETISTLKNSGVKVTLVPLREIRG